MNTMIMNRQGMHIETKIRLRDYLSEFITTRRFDLFNEVVRNRTRYVTVALENIYQPHNASAVLRSCDCFGVHDVHIIENENTYEVNHEIALGSSQWLNLITYPDTGNSTTSCIQNLKSQGYRIIATTPRPSTPSIENFDVGKGKFALIFGTEKEGLTDTAMDLADEFIRLPMYGFTESFNISVSAALCLFHCTAAIRQNNVNWMMTDEEMIDVQLDWLRTSIHGSELIENNFLKKNN
jgi:tRNA (guanosine-2'-O-)-methyltransferase